jgi:hypothetical protein
MDKAIDKGKINGFMDNPHTKSKEVISSEKTGTNNNPLPTTNGFNCNIDAI